MSRASRHMRRRRRRAAMSGLLTAGALALGGAAAAPEAKAVNLIRSDLDFILQQIRIAEAHAAGGSLTGPGPLQVGSPLLPFGLRTVDGRLNNIVPGQELFGSADQVFKRLTNPLFRPAESATSYAQTAGTVVDSQPRAISNLIADATTRNPAAVAAAAQTPGSVQVPEPVPDGQPDPFFIPNRAPDEGLSAPFNSWFTFFGQFFDHGLDLVTKGGNGTVMIPLQPGDPLIAGPDNTLGTADDLPPGQQVMFVTRATNQGATREHQNTTTPFVDQNQTYTSHPAHQVFLREYELRGGVPVSTGRMLDNPAVGGLATWADVKAQAQTLLGITLTDQQVLNVPAVLTDPYGKFIPGAGGRPTLTGGSTGHAFLDDIAHHAAPRPGLVPDTLAGTADDNDPTTYDDELLNAHYITGDGRGNENIGLTTVHHVFHAEHNRLVDDIKARITATGDATFIAQWQVAPNVWNGERIFQAARFATEMQYQHLVFEEFARKMQPAVNVFAGYNTDLDPAIVAEFAHTVYRFGHSMLPETVARTSAAGADQSLPLVQAFLNPVAFQGDPATVAGAIVRGNVRQVGNEIDEFVTDAVRDNLLGLPLDLGAINLARGRDTGIPPLQAVRRTFNAATNDSALAPYDSWTDFGLGLRHPESLVNFIAAYGKHPSVTGAATPAAKRVAAEALVGGADPDFMNSIGAWAAGAVGTTPDADPATVTGLGDVDLWIGGLAEKPLPFGGMLGSTFNFVFETQLEKLQDGDRFYYLHRLAGTNFLAELENNSFAGMIERTTNATHLPGDVFSRPDFTFERSDPPTGTPRVGDEWSIPDDPTTPTVNEARTLVSVIGGQFRFVGPEHVLMGGTNSADNLRTDIGDDTVWADGGNDRLEGGAGNDILNGGAGNDISTDSFGADNIKGDAGNDAVNAGPGDDLVLGGDGNDFVDGGDDLNEVFAGNDNDMVRGGASADIVFGGAGDDWLEGGNQTDALVGGHGAPFEDATSDGNDVVDGQGGDDDQHGEGGDDILKSGQGIEAHEGMLGFDWVTHKGDTQPGQSDLSLSVLLPPDIANIRDRFRLVEGLSGWNQNDILRGDDATAATMIGNEITSPAQIGNITGLQGVLGAGVTAFTGGNIILGGAGSDILEGRAGNDIVDGDKWLDVQLQDGAAAPVDTMAQLQAGVFAGTVDPGNVAIRREIKTAPVDPNAIDTVEFSGALGEYTIDPPGPLPGSTVTVTHANPLPPIDDGTDRLSNVERLRFTDGVVLLVNNPNNNPATGAPAINDTTPREGQVLTASPGTLADSDGVGAITYSWQAETGTGSWVTIGSGPTYTPVNGDAGARLRVKATFPDGDGVLESGTSAPTAAVQNVNQPPTGTPVLSDTSPVIGDTMTVSTASIADPDGLAGVTFLLQWQQSDGSGWTNIVGATGTSFTPTAAQEGRQLRVLVTFTDAGGAPESVVSAPTEPTVVARVAAQSAPPRVIEPVIRATGIVVTRTADKTLASPKPLASPVLVRFRLNGAARVRLEIRTIKAKSKGTLVRVFNRNVKKAGLVTFKWDLTNTKKRVVTAGRYRIIVTITDRDGDVTSFTRKVTVQP